MNEYDELKEREEKILKELESIKLKQRLARSEMSGINRKRRNHLLIKIGAEWAKQNNVDINAADDYDKLFSICKSIMNLARRSLVSCPHCGEKVLFFEQDDKWQCVKCRAIFDNQAGRPLFTDCDGER